MKIFTIVGSLIQIWDDFNDYYCTSDQTGKPPCDIINGGTTWASATAMKHFSASQADEFKKCYGFSDPTKIKRVCELYDEIDLPSLYVEYMTKEYNLCKTLIDEIPNERIREAITIYIEWLVGQGEAVS